MSKDQVRKLSWKEIYQLSKTSLMEFFNADNFMHGAALAYYAIFALVPIVYLAITIFGTVVGEDVILEIIQDVLQQNIGISDVSGIMDFVSELNIAEGSFILKIVGVIVLLFSSTALLNAMRNSINNFFGIIPQKNRNIVLQTLISRAVSFGILSLFGITLILTYFTQTIIFSITDQLINSSSGARAVLYLIIEHGSLIAVNVILFAFIFKYLHDGKVKWKLAWGGSLFTSVMLYLGHLLIKFYLVNYFFAAGAGFAGTLMVILTWMFYSSQIIFLGAKFTAVYAKMVGRPITAK